MKYVILCKMLCKRKLDVRETVSSFKAQLVAKGVFQMEGADYFDTFAAFVPFEMFLLFLGKLVS